MLSIGEFSRVTRLTVKALRLYHEKGLLIPDRIDMDSKYRYYRSSAIEKAVKISRLKDMGFSLGEIKQILLECTDDAQMAEVVQKKLADVEATLADFKKKKEHLDLFLQSTAVPAENKTDFRDSISVSRDALPEALVCGIRFKGRYPEVGKYIGLLYKKVNRFALGKPFTLYYDGEYKEDGADIEVCVRVKKELHIDGSHCRLLPAAEGLAATHHGPYQDLGNCYGRLYSYCREHNLTPLLPIREEYIKGPGYIFRGNPRNYITRCFLPVSPEWGDGHVGL